LGPLRKTGGKKGKDNEPVNTPKKEKKCSLQTKRPTPPKQHKKKKR